MRFKTMAVAALALGMNTLYAQDNTIRLILTHNRHREGIIWERNYWISSLPTTGRKPSRSRLQRHLRSERLRMACLTGIYL